MTIRLFNACLAAGWLMLVLGLALWSVPAGLVVGGAVLMAVTLLLAFRAGVGRPPRDNNEEG